MIATLADRHYFRARDEAERTRANAVGDRRRAIDRHRWCSRQANEETPLGVRAAQFATTVTVYLNKSAQIAVTLITYVSTARVLVDDLLRAFDLLGRALDRHGPLLGLVRIRVAFDLNVSARLSLDLLYRFATATHMRMKSNKTVTRC